MNTIFQRFFLLCWISIVAWYVLIPLQGRAQQQDSEGGIFVAQCTPDTCAWTRYPIEAFPNTPSIKQGQSINFYVANGDSLHDYAKYKIQIFRIGSTNILYRTVADTFTLRFQPLHDSIGRALPAKWHSDEPRPYDFKKGCNWPIAYSLSVPQDWKSGIYFAKCSLKNDTTIFRRALFVVREDTPGVSSNILYKLPYSTYQAYNSWGGSSLYTGLDAPNTNTLVPNNDTVSFLRPLGGNHQEIVDIGAFDLAESCFVRWVERSGYVMEYCTNLDLDSDGVAPPANPNQYGFISKYKFIVTSGHDEYWSSDERNDIELGFIQNQSIGGGNAAFLSGNVCYWKDNYFDNRTRMRVGKYSGFNYRWRSPDQGNNDEAKFIGVQWETGYSYQGVHDVVQMDSNWLFKGTGLHNGNPFGYGFNDNFYGNTGIVGGEVDHRVDKSPSNVEIISSATVSGVLHEAAFHIDTSSNARIFGAGSIHWSRGLQSDSSSDKAKFITIMTNLMDHFSQKKFLGKIYGAANKWTKDVEIDGNANIVVGATLKLDNNMTLTIDQGDTLYVDGTLQLSGNVNIVGVGGIKFSSTGRVTIMPTSIVNWNMVSVPAGVSSYSMGVLYPSAVSDAFAAVNGQYVVQNTLVKGSGYWVKFNSAPTITYSGTPVVAETINVSAGWNLIGTISLPLPTLRVVQSPPGIVVSNYFGYKLSGYSPDTTLYPGQGYWVKASQSGQLILKTSTTSNFSITATDPCPPAPPEISLAAPVLSCSSCTPGNNPTLSWTAVSGATNYQLWQYICPWTEAGCEGVPTVIYSGPDRSCTDHNYTVFHKTGTNLVPTSVLFYYVVAQNNFCQASGNSDTLAINSGDGQIIDKQGRKETAGEERQLPTVTKLEANYPNPFNPTTTIPYQLAFPGNVSMRVYNVLGGEVARLVESEREAGYYTSEWDASNSSSGIYYLRMIVTDQNGKQVYQAMKKLLLMK